MDVPIEIKAIGTVEPLQSVTVRSQVGGYLTRINFKEGDDVQTGQTLFQIDPRAVDASLDQALANLERDRAQAENAERQLNRYSELFKNHLISQEEFDQAKTTAEALKAAVKADEAAAQRMRLDRQFSSIKAPISGRTGALLVTLGNLIKVNDTQLVTINQIMPISVKFSVPEKYLPQIRQALSEREIAVRAVPSASDASAAEGKLIFVDNAVDAGTGTVALKAQFENSDRSLWPGQYVDITIVLGALARAVVIPSQAVMTGQQGPYVFVLDAQGAAQVRKVQPGEGTDSMTVIKEGIAAGEKVVTDGQLRVVPGSKVAVKESPEGSQEKAL